MSETFFQKLARTAGGRFTLLWERHPVGGLPVFVREVSETSEGSPERSSSEFRRDEEEKWKPDRRTNSTLGRTNW